jgi:acetyl esterase/lipase
MKLKKGFIMIQNKFVLHFKNIILWIIALFLLTCQSVKKIDVRNCKTNIDVNSQINYIHSEPESFQSKFLKFGATVLGMKDGLDKAMEKNKGRSEAQSPSDSLKIDFIFTQTKFKERSFWTISPKNNKSEKVILYLHGGAYINNIVKFQWDMMEEIARKTKSKIVVPDYPLSPESTYSDVYSFIESVYNDLLTQTKSENIVFLGDSAGGALSLGLAQKLQKEKKAGPSQMILISPWLDVTMSDPEVKKIDPLDKVLSIKGLVWAGKVYAGKQSTQDPLISPIYGDSRGLGKISIFIGTHDVLHSDSMRLKKNLEANKIPFNYFEYPNMFHVWPAIVGMKESDSAIEQISNLVICGK